jgi:hypothetical protein
VLSYRFVSLNVADPDSEFLKNPKFRAFQEEMVKELVAFDRVKEWADIIKCLKRVQKVHQPTNQTTPNHHLAIVIIIIIIIVVVVVVATAASISTHLYPHAGAC